MKAYVALCAVFVATTGTAASTQRGPMNMDVAGVKLGMPKAQAVRAIEAAGYQCRGLGRQPTFAEAVELEADRRRGRSIAWRLGSQIDYLACTGPNGEDLKVNFVELKSGALVDRLSLLVGGDRVDLPAVRRQLAAKYGKPTMGEPLAGSWCDPGYRCGMGAMFSVGPVFTVNARDSILVSAGRGSRVREAEEAAVRAAADAVAPKRGGAAL